VLRTGKIVKPQPTGPLPLVLSSEARRKGFSYLFREQPRSYSNKALHTCIDPSVSRRLTVIYS
jgi:hypothetical protein